MLAFVEYGMHRALTWGTTRSLVLMLNENRMIFHAGIPAPKTSRELDIYRSIIKDPTLNPQTKETLAKIVSLYGDSY
jgi:hypothetical protein